MSLSIAEAILEGTNKLREGGVPEPRREAGSLLESVLARDRTFLITHSETRLTREDVLTFQERLGRRADGEPLQYITGLQDFFGLRFAVSRDALIPRPETELLVEAALDVLGPGSRALICDVGTGTGCIPISLLHEMPEARAVAVDLSRAAVGLAKRNAARHSVSERISLLVADSLSALAVQPRFDLVVSNPPYVPDAEWETLQREVRDHEPRLALTSGSDGLTMIRRLLVETPGVLVKGGHFVFEMGYRQGAAVEEAIDPGVWELLRIRDDLQGIPRIAVLRKR